MKVFMLGWEFPPVVSGGLGVACYGLAKALNALGVDVLFVLPKPLTGNGHGAAPPLRRHIHRVRQLAAASENDVHSALEHAAEHAAAVQATDHTPTTEAPPPERQPFDAGPVGAAVAQEPSPAGDAVQAPDTDPSSESASPASGAAETSAIDAPDTAPLQRVTFIPLDVLLQPYMTAQQYQRMVVEQYAGSGWARRAMSSGPDQPAAQPANMPAALQPSPQSAAPAPLAPAPPPLAPVRPSHYLEHHGAPPKVVGPANSSYAGDLFAETDRYARLALAVAKGENFDVVHAHDWMTFEAAIAVAAAAGKPLVVQIHSTELDRAGGNANSHIMELERQGMVAADRIVAVSYKTKTQLIEKYGIDPRKIEVVYNATDPAAAAPPPTPAASPAPTPAAEVSAGKPSGHARKTSKPRHAHKTVLFLGRLTQQKGPDLFLHAAKKVLSVEADVKFVVAGKGDMLDLLKDLADQLEIRHQVIFTGFLKKSQAEKAFAAADLYVMPSISEPFGIATLEALAHDVPVIVSKQSGVAEVLQHVLKVDFWDTEDLANKILAVLRHPPLAATLREQGQEEVRQLSWEDSAARISELYTELERSQANEPQPVTR